MKLPRSFVALVAAAAMGLTACSSGTSVGKDLDTSIKTRPSDKPTNKKPDKKPSEKPTPTQTKTQKPAGPKPENHEVFAKDGNYFDPLDLAARRGDAIVFKNMDEAGSDGAANTHSWTVKGYEKDGDGNVVVDSGPVKSGAQAKVVVNLPAGIYDFYCTLIPYMVGGKIAVYE